MSNAKFPDSLVLLGEKERAIEEGHFLGLDAISSALHISRDKLHNKMRRGELFSIDVHGRPYIPAFLVGDENTRERLWELCKLIQPAPPDARLRWLFTARSSIWNLRPVDCLRDSGRFHYARFFAKAWASEWSRTVVSIHAKQPFDSARTDGAPHYRAVLEIDPRIRLWSRVAATVGSNEESNGRPPVGRMTLSVCRLTPPNMQRLECELVLSPADAGQSLAIRSAAEKTYLLPLPKSVRVRDTPAVISYLAEHMRGGGQAGGMTLTRAAEILGADVETIRVLMKENRLEQVRSRDSGARNAHVTVNSVRSLRTALSIQGRSGS
ncbi:hypothetical protein [Caballeronia grimmiae]|uniref:hypothetical protein n=1 Tax=Caballeronia grimmiae TaxID=1071679 RepID=UPI0038B93E81